MARHHIHCPVCTADVFYDHCEDVTEFKHCPICGNRNIESQTIKGADEPCEGEMHAIVGQAVRFHCSCCGQDPCCCCGVQIRVPAGSVLTVTTPKGDQ